MTSYTNIAKDSQTIEFDVAGVSYRLQAFAQAAVKIGDRLKLTADPANQFDPNAITVSKGDLLIGYVPKYLCRTVHALAAIGDVECTVEELGGRSCGVALGWKDSAALPTYKARCTYVSVEGVRVAALTDNFSPLIEFAEYPTVEEGIERVILLLFRRIPNVRIKMVFPKVKSIRMKS